MTDSGHLTSHRAVIETEQPLAETLDRCIEIAESVVTGRASWVDGSTLLAHLRVLREDLSLTERCAA